MEGKLQSKSKAFIIGEKPLNLNVFIYFHSRGLLYKSSLDCLKKTIQDEGILAIYKGFLPIWIRMAPWSLTFWLSFEQIRHTMGVRAF